MLNSISEQGLYQIDGILDNGEILFPIEVPPIPVPVPPEIGKYPIVWVGVHTFKAPLRAALIAHFKSIKDLQVSLLKKLDIFAPIQSIVTLPMKIKTSLIAKTLERLEADSKLRGILLEKLQKEMKLNGKKSYKLIEFLLEDENED